MLIRGYFGEVSEANKAIKELNKAGFKDAFLDANDHHITEQDFHTNLAGTQGSTSLSNLSLYSSGDNKGEGNSSLKAANPMVSGMSSMEEITDVNFTVNLNVDNNNIEKAKSIMEEAGGRTDNPNVNVQDDMEGSDIDYAKIATKLDDTF